MDELTARKTALQAELRTIQREEKEYDIVQQNVDMLLKDPLKQQKSHILE